MQLSKDFITHEIDGDHIMISIDSDKFSGIVRSNATAATIIECLKEETSVEAVADRLAEEYEGVTREQATADVEKIVEQLKDIGAIED